MQPTKGKNALLQDRQLDPLGGTRTYLSTHMKLVKPSDPAERKTVVYDSDEERRKKNSMMHKFGASNSLPRKTVAPTMFAMTKPIQASNLTKQDSKMSKDIVPRVTQSNSSSNISSSGSRPIKAINPFSSTSLKSHEVSNIVNNEKSISGNDKSIRAINQFVSTSSSKSHEVTNSVNNERSSSGHSKPVKATNPFLSTSTSTSSKSHEVGNTVNNENKGGNEANNETEAVSVHEDYDELEVFTESPVNNTTSTNTSSSSVPTQHSAVESRAELFVARLIKSNEAPIEPVVSEAPVATNPVAPITAASKSNDNFVRRKLNKHHGDNSKYASMKRKHEKIASRIANKDDDNEDSGADNAAESDSDIDVFEERRKPTKEVPGSIGIDPLDLCLTYLQPSNKATDTSSTKAIELSHVTKHVAVQRATTVPPAKVVRGLDVQPKKRRSTRDKEMSEELLQEIAPKCNGHNFPAKLLKVKKAESKNKGRKFYCCSLSMEDRCNFFMWYDDNPALISMNMAQMKQKEEQLKGMTPAEKWCQNALDAYLQRLDVMTLHDLKNEIRVCNRVIQSSKQKVKKAIKVSGTKAELIASLTSHARTTLQKSYKEVGMQSAIGKGAVDAGPQVVSMPVARAPPVTANTVDLSSSDESGDESIDVVGETEQCEGGDNDVVEEDEEELEEEDEEEEEEVEEEEEDTSMSKKKGRKRVVVTVNSDDDDDDAALTPEEHVLNLCFGFKRYREGQMWAIERTIRGSNSLIVMPTGSGKSICYIIPAIMMPGITIVVSPLIALMQDQLNKLPMQLPGALFGGRMSTYDVSKITTSLLAGYVKLLYVSPERLCTSSFRHLIKLLHQSKGPDAVSLLCVDEAHCISQWSYNFRPAFLRIRKEIDYIQPTSILAMTATATPRIKEEIVSHLRITDDSVYSIPSRRENLTLYASKVDMEEDRKKELLRILCADSDAEGEDSGKKRGRNKTTPNTIIYVAYKYETEVLSEFLRGHGIAAAAYHGSMDSEERAKVYSQFDSGTVRVIVATVAFGMGVDKADVRQIIHSCLPKTVENYLQEIGRAGRDGQAASCHLIYRKEDAIDSLSLANSTRMSVLQVMGLCRSIFKPRVKAGTNKCLLQQYTTLPLTQCSIACDITESMVETVLSVLEMQPFNLVNVEGTYMSRVKGTFKYDSSKHKEIASSVVVSAMIKCNTCPQRKEQPRTSVSFFNDSSKGVAPASHTGSSYKLQEFECNIEDICNETGLERNQITKVLYSLQSNGIVSYTLSNPAVFITTNACRHLEFNSVQDVYSWISTIALKIIDKSDAMETLTKQRILDMWKIARIISGEQIETVSPAGGEKEKQVLQLNENHQNTMMLFLCHYLDHLSGNNPLDAHRNESAEVDAVTSVFHSLSPPTCSIDEKIKGIIQRDAQYVANDNRVVALVDDMLREAKVFSECCDYNHEVIRLRAMYISKIFHGVATVKLLTSDWKGSCQQWGAHRHVDFDQLLHVVLAALQEETQE